MALITKIKTIYSEVVAALGFTPENPANKGVANGYAGLDAGGRVPSAQLPSYVDDVLEYPNLASFPNPGAAGIIYLALDTNIIYRWGGSTYVDIASGDVAWADVTGKPAFGTLSLQDANSVNITGGTVNATSSIIGNLSLATNQITSTQAIDDILITPTGIGALKVQNRITLEDTLSFGPLDPQGSYFANNAEYLQAGPLSAWSYLQNGTATKVEFDNGAAMTIANAASGNAGDLILGWTEVLNISSAGNVVTGNWTAGVIGSDYGGTGVDNGGNLLNITANASISGTNTGDQTITLTGDVTGSGTGSFGATLANSGVTAGTYGNVTQVPQITVDAKGRITGVTNITLPAIPSTFDDNVFTIQDETDNTKKLQFQASSIATGTTRILTAPNVNGTIITSADTGTVTNTMLAGSIADSKLNAISTAGKVANSATTATHTNTPSAIVSRDAFGDFSATNLTLSGQLVSTQANNAQNGSGQIFLNGTIGNRIDFNINGVGAPTFTTRGVGTKIVLYPLVGPAAVDYAIGVEGATLWFSVPKAADQFKYYGGTTVLSRLADDGVSSRGVVYQGNSAITTQNTGTTLTIGQLLTLVIRTTPTANITFTLPTGTNTDAGVMSGLETFRSFTWSIVNTAAFTVTMAGNTGMTYVGNTTIAANTSASFRTIKTATNTFTTYRI